MALQILRLLLCSQVEAPAAEGNDVLEDGVPVFPVDKVLRGDRLREPWIFDQTMTSWSGFG